MVTVFRFFSGSGRSESSADGFTLIEVTIGLMIVGILSIPLMQGYKIYMAEKIIDESSGRLSTIQSALQKYAVMYGHYPIPSERNLGIGDLGFGQPYTGAIPTCASGLEPICRTIIGSRDAVLPAGPDPVLIGDVPFAALGLPEKFIKDAYKNKFTYAVTETLVTQASFGDSLGAIRILDRNALDGDDDDRNYPGSDAHYVLVSHGKNKKGAFTVDGQLVSTCNPPGVDIENCDGDAIFISNYDDIGTGIDAVYERFSSFVEGTDYYDDYIAATRSTNSGIWVRTANTSDIFNTEGRRIRIGPGSSPSAYLEVTDGNVLASTLHASRLCPFSGCENAGTNDSGSENVLYQSPLDPPSRVFDPAIFGGTPDATHVNLPGGGLNCGHQGVSGIRRADEDCSNLAPNPPPAMGGCGVGATGVDGSGALICF